MPAPSSRTEIHRKAQRAHYDTATVNAIIDHAFLCHIAFRHGDSVHCLPTACWRHEGDLYIHGAKNSRLIQALLAGEAALCITHLDGLVLARSAFHHSMNYRSVAIYGQFSEVKGEAEKAVAMHAFMEHVSPGRSALARPAAPNELAGTSILRISTAEAAAKIRNWGVEDSVEDLAIPVWAGVIPLHQHAGPAQPENACEAFPPPQLPAFLGAIKTQAADQEIHQDPNAIG